MKKLSAFAWRWIILIAIIIIVYVGYQIFSYFYVYSGDTFLQAPVISVASSTTGKVKTIYAHEGQSVAQGEILFDIAALKSTTNNTDAVRAPTSGTLVNFVLQAGDSVQSGDKVTGIINTSRVWIRARIKETSLRYVHIGDQVTIQLRMYPGQLLFGHVTVIGAGVNRVQASTSVISSVLPYLEQTENWIQLAQRFPVMILIDKLPAGVQPRVGATARVLIHRSH